MDECGELALPYGDETIRWLFRAEAGQTQVLQLPYRPGLPDVPGAVRQALRAPLAGPPLAEAVRGRGPVLILVSDLTRAVPYHDVLPALVAELTSAGLLPSDLAFLTATGAHRALTPVELEECYGPVARAGYAFFQHDADAGNVCLGQLSTGNELWIDERAVDAGFRIVVSMVTPHYFAGYSGSRKSILPGVAGRETIRANHARIIHPYARLTNLTDNVIHQEMMEAARIVGVDFDLELVVNDEREIVGVFGGAMEATFPAAVAACDNLYRVPVPAPADVVVVSAGGYPKDINLYQTQKAANHAALVTAPGGTMILVAECRDGVGSAQFEETLRRAASPAELAATPEELSMPRAHPVGFAARPCSRGVCHPAPAAGHRPAASSRLFTEETIRLGEHTAIATARIPCSRGVCHPAPAAGHRPAASSRLFTEETIRLGEHTAIATARILQQCEVVVVSDLPRETVEGMHFTHAATLDEALAYARTKHGPAALTYVIPHGGFILPVVTRSFTAKTSPAPCPR